MQRHWSKPLYYSFLLVVILRGGVMLSGCDVLDFLGDLFRIGCILEAAPYGHTHRRTLASRQMPEVRGAHDMY
jgi:hypothetical protein